VDPQSNNERCFIISAATQEVSLIWTLQENLRP
jgi:hypothetical protein